MAPTTKPDGTPRTAAGGLCTLATIPKSHVFTSKLPADAAVPSPDVARRARPSLLRQSRPVRSAVFTWVAPEPRKDPRLLAVSPRCMELVGLRPDEERRDDFAALVAGNKIYDDHYPWAQCYGGYQFGQWAGQLGDGRAFSIVELTNARSGVRHELQLKGGGKTPYCRFADGNAVLRSSIREFLASEALAALDIPTTRALSLTLLPHNEAMRERLEPCAVVCRVAPSWLRIGSFDLPHVRGDRALVRKLADYCIDEVFCRTTFEVAGDENRYVLLYREIVRRSAVLVARMQSYGFMNGVLNTDNTSILGLSMDYGPFAFMDTFDPSHTPNHDDSMLRYCYRMQPTVFWWNLIKLGEALGALLGGADADDTELSEAVSSQAIRVIESAGEEFKAVFLAEYRSVMTKRAGLLSEPNMDFFSNMLSIMEDCAVDYNHFFYRLGHAQLFGEQPNYVQEALKILPADKASDQEVCRKLSHWLEHDYRHTLDNQGSRDDAERSLRSDRSNPRFVLRQWILDEVIERVEKKKDYHVLQTVLNMALFPYERSWDSDQAEQDRWCGDVPVTSRLVQCSCSS